MVKAIVDIDREASRIIIIPKAEYDLKDKSDAINEMVRQCKELVLESEIQPE